MKILSNHLSFLVYVSIFMNSSLCFILNEPISLAVKSKSGIQQLPSSFLGSSPSETRFHEQLQSSRRKRDTSDAVQVNVVEECINKMGLENKRLDDLDEFQLGELKGMVDSKYHAGFVQQCLDEMGLKDSEITDLSPTYLGELQGKINSKYSYSNPSNHSLVQDCINEMGLKHKRIDRLLSVELGELKAKIDSKHVGLVQECLNEMGLNDEKINDLTPVQLGELKGMIDSKHVNITSSEEGCPCGEEK